MGGQSIFGAQPIFELETPAYFIGRYPITVREYNNYVDDVHRAPQYWDKQILHPEHPAVYVSWLDALAYTRWLSAVTGKGYRLPTEAEWEKAACWDDNRSLLYPWGNSFDSNCCNTRESKLFTTSPVDTYFSGRSPCGAQDMVGNVWEWCSSLYRQYPYLKDDGREDLASKGRRVQRGGSWRMSAEYAWCRSRGNFNPSRGGDTEGFRIAVDYSDLTVESKEL
jgi:formylglycine-generating enzyme required for sulfatase activity